MNVRSFFYFVFVSLFWGDFGQELFCKACHLFVVLRKGETWDGTDIKTGVGTSCSECSEKALV